MEKQIIQANEDIENYKKVLNEEKNEEAKIFDKKDYEMFLKHAQFKLNSLIFVKENELLKMNNVQFLE